MIPVPLVLWEGDEESLTCARVIPYLNGFEIELRRRGPGPRPTPDFSTPQRLPNQHFHGLSVALRYADGREERLDDLVRPDKEDSITITTFDRSGFDDSLWLWVMPLPPPGQVRMTIEWPARGIQSVSVSFDGATIRPNEDKWPDRP